MGKRNRCPRGESVQKNFWRDKADFLLFLMDFSGKSPIIRSGNLTGKER
jgi:hypothetical protein